MAVSPSPLPSPFKAAGGGSRHDFSRLGAAVLYLVLTVVALAAVFPFYWMLIAATHRSATILTAPPPMLPGTALAQNYQDLMAGVPFWQNMLNSVFVAGTTTVLVLFFCSLAGYAFAKYQFPGRDTLFALMLATMMIPNVLGIIPSFMLMRWLGWLNTYLPLIVPSAVSAFGIFWMRQYIQGAVPNDLIDAARIDGAHEFRIYWNIVLPVITPALAALAIMTFMAKWNDFFWPLLILKDKAKYTIPVALSTLQGLYSREEGVRLLGASLAVLPVLIVFLLASRRFMAGLTAGAVKGM
jgi:ABC-type glycerol-3-phosphate transport system permease component